MKPKAASQYEIGWIEDAAKVSLSESARGIVVVGDNGEIHGGVAYDSWRPNSVQMHIALKSPIAGKHLLGPAFEYPFLEVGVGVVYGLISAHNKRSLGLARKLGFSDSARIRDGYAPGKDLIVLEMRKEHCRWLYGQRKVA